jgi:hypothetical protein
MPLPTDFHISRILLQLLFGIISKILVSSASKKSEEDLYTINVQVQETISYDQELEYDSISCMGVFVSLSRRIHRGFQTENGNIC